MKQILILLLSLGIFTTNIYSQKFLGTLFLLETGKAINGATKKVGIYYNESKGSFVPGFEFYYGLGSPIFKEKSEDNYVVYNQSRDRDTNWISLWL